MAKQWEYRVYSPNNRSCLFPVSPRRNPVRYRSCISKSDKRGSFWEKVKERSAQIEKKRFFLPSRTLSPSSSINVGKDTYIYT